MFVNGNNGFGCSRSPQSRQNGQNSCGYGIAPVCLAVFFGEPFFLERGGKVSREFGMVMEKTYGVKQSQPIYWKMAEDSFRIGTKKLVGDFTMDLLGYALSPFAIVWNLRGYGITFSGWNYSMMQHHTPNLTKYYVYYAGNILPLVLLLALALYLWNGDKRGFAANAQRMGLTCLGVLSAVVALWYSLSASGMQDYKNAILITIFWGLLVTAFMEEKKSSFNEQK